MEYIFNDLPEEIILLIFSFLSEKDVCLNCSLVCKKWNDLSADRSLIKAWPRIHNGDDLTSVFEDICYDSRYLSFDYITCYVSENYHTLGICGKNLWENGFMMATRSNDTKLIKRFIKYGIPHIDQSVNALYYAIVTDSLDVIKILTEEYLYKNHVILRFIELANRHGNPDIISYLESMFE